MGEEGQKPGGLEATFSRSVLAHQEAWQRALILTVAVFPFWAFLLLSVNLVSSPGRASLENDLRVTFTLNINS